MSRTHFVYSLLCFWVIGYCVSNAYGQEPPDPNSPSEQNKRWKRVLYWKQRTRLLQLQKQEGGLLGAIERLDRQNVQLLQRVKQLRKRAEMLRVRVRLSAKEWNARKKQSARLLKKIQPRMRSFYRLVRLGKARILLGSQSLKDLAYRWRALQLTTVQDIRLLRMLQSMRQKAKRTAQRWKTKKAQLQSVLTRLQKESSTLQRQRRDKAMALQALYKEVHVYRRALRELRGSGKALLSMLHKWQKKAPAGGLARLKGQIPWPIARYSRFCKRYQLKKQGSFYALLCKEKVPQPLRLKGTHNRPGLTLPIPSGTPVQAVAAGTCVHQGWIRGYGQVVLLDHGQKFYSLYAHLSEISVKKGQLIEARGAIGATGATGMLGKPVLYFELRHHSRVLPAVQWLQTTQ